MKRSSESSRQVVRCEAKRSCHELPWAEPCLGRNGEINDLITDLANITCLVLKSQRLIAIDMIARCFGMFGVYHLESIGFFPTCPNCHEYSSFFGWKYLSRWKAFVHTSIIDFQQPIIAQTSSHLSFRKFSVAKQSFPQMTLTPSFMEVFSRESTMSPLTQAGRTGRLPHPFGKAVLVAHGCLVYWCVEWQLRGVGCGDVRLCIQNFEIGSIG